MHQCAGGWQTKDQQLLEAAKANQVQNVRRLLALKANPCFSDSRTGDTALHFACQHKLASSDLVDVLLAAGATTEAADCDQWRPMHWAAFHDAEPALSRLVDAGADVNCRNIHGETPLHWACKHDCARAVRVLVRNPRIVIDACDKRQESAMEWAVRARSERALGVLREAPAREGPTQGSRGT